VPRAAASLRRDPVQTPLLSVLSLPAVAGPPAAAASLRPPGVLRPQGQLSLLPWVVCTSHGTALSSSSPSSVARTQRPPGPRRPSAHRAGALHLEAQSLELSAERIRDRNFSTDSFITSVIGDGQCNIGCGALSLRGRIPHWESRVHCDTVQGASPDHIAWTLLLR
jgi:hypothetical protein